LLEEIGVEAYKIPSGEVTNLPLLERVAETGKPVLLSSGMSDWAELDAAVDRLKGGGLLTVLQCTSAYPCPAERVGLNVLAELRDRYGVPVGFSDHTNGCAAAFAAATLGATVIEKHFTFSRLMYGSDAANAMEPPDFQQLAGGLREIWEMTDNPIDKDDISRYREMKTVFEKSVVTARPLEAGATVTLADLAFKKPGDGIPAARYREIIGKKTRTALAADHKLEESDLS
jgi:N,N'-diacetyllegionaminate synthase